MALFSASSSEKKSIHLSGSTLLVTLIVFGTSLLYYDPLHRRKDAYLCDASGIRLFLQPVINHLSICNVLPQQVVDCFSEPSKDSFIGLLACPSMGLTTKLFFLRRRSFARETPVMRCISARLTFLISKFGPIFSFIWLRPCVMSVWKSLPFISSLFIDFVSWCIGHPLALSESERLAMAFLIRWSVANLIRWFYWLKKHDDNNCHTANENGVDKIHKRLEINGFSSCLHRKIEGGDKKLIFCSVETRELLKMRILAGWGQWN